jgi:hypothetical protein
MWDWLVATGLGLNGGSHLAAIVGGVLGAIVAFALAIWIGRSAKGERRRSRDPR